MCITIARIYRVTIRLYVYEARARARARALLNPQNESPLSLIARARVVIRHAGRLYDAKINVSPSHAYFHAPLDSRVRADLASENKNKKKKKTRRVVGIFRSRAVTNA